MKLQGPCARLEKAGAQGRWTSNIQRDMLRQSSTGDDVTRFKTYTLAKVEIIIEPTRKLKELTRPFDSKPKQV